MRKTASCAVAIAAASLLLPGAGAGGTSTGVIVFQSYGNQPSAHDGIWIANGDGSHLRRLAHQPAMATAPRLSPDGRQVALFSLSPRAATLDVMRIDGTALRRLRVLSPLTTQAEAYEYPSWAPDGRTLLVEGGHLCKGGVAAADDVCRSALYSLALSSGRVTRIAGTANVHWGGDWSPDGHAILFSRWTGSGYGLAIVHPGGATTTLTAGIGTLDAFARWRPDGHAILFTRQHGGGGSKLFTITPSGSQTQQLRLASSDSSAGSWSPNGKQIVFVTNGGTNGDIYTATLPGLELHRITDTPQDDSLPDWRR